MNEPTKPLAEHFTPLEAKIRKILVRYADGVILEEVQDLPAYTDEAARAIAALTAQEAAPPSQIEDELDAVCEQLRRIDIPGDAPAEKVAWLVERAAPPQPTREQIARECYAVGEFDEVYDPEKHDQWWNEDGDAAGFALQYLELADRIRALYASPSEPQQKEVDG